VKFQLILAGDDFFIIAQQFLLISEEARRKGYGNIRKIF